MKSILTLIFLFIALLTSFAQVVGTTFPEMKVETVHDSTIVLPQATNGKYTLLGLAYSKKSEDELNTWFSPVFNKFIQKQKGILADLGYDVNIYFVPMFTGLNAAAIETAKKQALKKVDSQLLPYILFYSGELKKYKDALSFGERDTPYFYVLDPGGKIVYTTSGAYSDAKMDAIEESIQE